MLTFKKTHQYLSTAANDIASALGITRPTVDILIDGVSTSAVPFPERNAIGIELRDMSDKAFLNALYSLAYNLYYISKRNEGDSQQMASDESTIFADSFIDFIMNGDNPHEYLALPYDDHNLIYLKKLLLPIITRVKQIDD